MPRGKGSGISIPLVRQNPSVGGKPRTDEVQQITNEKGPAEGLPGFIGTDWFHRW